MHTGGILTGQDWALFRRKCGGFESLKLKYELAIEVWG
jgi:hypothetical protein